MKKAVYIKLDCRLEKELDREAMSDFFQKMKEMLKLGNRLPEKNLASEKPKKI